MKNNTELSTRIRNNTEALINSFVIEDKKLRTLGKRRERKELTDRFTIAIGGMIMLMNEMDRKHTLELLDRHALIRNVERSANRIRRSRRLQFSYG